MQNTGVTVYWYTPLISYTVEKTATSVIDDDADDDGSPMCRGTCIIC